MLRWKKTEECCMKNYQVAPKNKALKANDLVYLSFKESTTGASIVNNTYIIFTCRIR